MNNNKKELILGILSLVCRIILAGIFLVASLGKISQPALFMRAVEAYQTTPKVFLPYVAIFIPWLEAIMAFMLLFGIRSEAAALITSGLFAVFMFSILQAIFRGLDISCGCFDLLAAADEKLGWHTFIRDVYMVLPAIFLLFFYRPFLAVDNIINKLFK